MRQHLADTLDALGRRQEAEAQRSHARVSVQNTKKSHVTLHAQAKLLDREHRYAEAYELHEQALSLVPLKQKELRLELMMHLVLSAFNAGRPADSLRWAETHHRDRPRMEAHRYGAADGGHCLQQPGPA